MQNTYMHKPKPEQRAPSPVTTACMTVHNCHTQYSTAQCSLLSYRDSLHDTNNTKQKESSGNSVFFNQNSDTVLYSAGDRVPTQF